MKPVVSRDADSANTSDDGKSPETDNPKDNCDGNQNDRREVIWHGIPPYYSAGNP